MVDERNEEGRDSAQEVVAHVVRDTSLIRQIKEFDSTRHDIVEWIENFERALRLGSVDEKHYTDWLRVSIGDIGVAAVDDWSKEYEVVKEVLRKEFRSDRRKIEAQAKLKNMTKGELSWEKFTAQVKQIAAVASKNDKELKEFLTIQVMTSNMDFDLRKEVMNKEYTESSQVLRRIAQIEALGSIKVAKIRDDSKVDYLENKVAELEKQLEDSRISKVEINGQQCFECLQRGHIRRNCPQFKRRVALQRGNQIPPYWGEMQAPRMPLWEGRQRPQRTPFWRGMQHAQPPPFWNGAPYGQTPPFWDAMSYNPPPHSPSEAATNRIPMGQTSTPNQKALEHPNYSKTDLN